MDIRATPLALPVLPVGLSYQATVPDTQGNPITVGLYADKDGVVRIAPVVGGKLQIP